MVYMVMGFQPRSFKGSSKEQNQHMYKDTFFCKTSGGQNGFSQAIRLTKTIFEFHEVAEDHSSIFLVGLSLLSFSSRGQRPFFR